MEAPFQQQITDATAKAEAIDQEAAIRTMLDRIVPAGQDIRTAIKDQFIATPDAWWKAVIEDIASQTHLGDPAEDLPQ